MLPMFKKSHINTRAIEDYINRGDLKNYSDDSNKKNALKQASLLYKMVDGDLYRHGSDREYSKYGLRVVVHDDEPQRKLDIISKCHMDEMGNHYGMNNTIKNVNKLYYWHGLSSHVKMFLKKCEHCKERSKFSMEEWLEEEKRNLSKKRMMGMEQMSTEVQKEIKGLGRIKKATPPETFFIVNAQRKVALDSLSEDPEMLIDSNNIEFVVETLGNNEDGQELKEVCHVLNVPDIVPMPERFRSREIENFLKYGSYPSDFTQNQKSGLKGPAVQYCIVDDELYHNPSKKKADGGLRLVVHDDTPALKVKVMVESHLDEDGNHLGLNRTMQKVNEKYFWLGLSLDIRKFMAKCKICAHNRGRRLDEDTSRFTEEVKKLKERQVTQESGTSMEEVFATAYTLNKDGVGQQENYDQVYRLMGNDENDFTEITVKVVNGEIIQTVQDKDPEAFQLGEAELVPIGTDTEETVKEQESSEDINEIAATQSTNEACETVSDKEPNEQDAAQSETFIVAGAVEESTELQSMKGKDGDDNENNSSKTTDTNVSVETAIEMLVDNEGCKSSEAVELGDPQQSHDVTSQTPPELPHLYQQCVYLPKSMKSRAIEEYLADRTVTMGYTSFKLRELAENFMVEDDIMYRRASRYKGKQIVIHDDQPELKFKILTDYHRKPNGDHCSEMVTFTNIQYKFFWEELRWDVNRFYKLCHICVEDGIEIKTKKRVLSVEELKMKEYQQRKKQTETGLNAKRNKAFRLANKDKLETFKSWEKYGKDVDGVLQDGAVVWNLSLEHEEEVENGEGCPDQKESPLADDESDIEINLDEGSDTETPCDEMVTLTVYATQEQEGKIRELFQQRGWEYKLSSMKRCPTEKSEPGPEDLYEMMMMTTSDQDQAIQELFKSSEVEQVQSPTPDEVEAQELEEKPISKPSQTKVSNKTPVKEQVKKEDQKTFKKAVPKAKGTIKEEKPDQEQNARPDVVREEQGEKMSTNKPSKTKVPKKTPVKEIIKKEDQKPLEQEKTKGTSKRTATDLNESISESRRPRREIKRPRRFSPDRMDEEKKNLSPKKTPKLTEKFKPESPMVARNKQSQKTEEPDMSSQLGKELIKTDNVGPRSTPKSDKAKVVLNKTPGNSTPTRATRYSSRIHNTSNTEVITDKPGQKRKLDQGDSIAVKDINSPKVKQKVEVDGSKMIKEIKKEKVKSEHKKVNVTNEAEDIAFDVSKETDKTKGNMSEHFSKNIERFDDDEDYDDDDTFSDDEDFDEDDKRSVENTALEVLKVDKGFEMEAISIDGLYMCSLCDAEFVNEDDCAIHGLQNKCFIDCKLCGRMFRKNEKVELEKHRALHSESNMFPCSNCEKVFSDSKCLGIHMRGHTGKLDEICRVCGSSFHTSFQLASHMYRIHGESNMFKCDICKAKFVNINFMKSEVLFDGVLSYFQCVMCNK